MVLCMEIDRGDFTEMVLSDLNRTVPEDIDDVCDVETGVLLAIRMEFGGWEITSDGFDALREWL